MMSEHYYSRNPSVKSNPQSFSFSLRGHSFTFTTDQGVFSKGEIDFGSRLLIDSIQMADVEGRILDVGCGYGPIGLTMAKEYPDRTIEMIDVNERALSLAEQNAKNNRVSNVEVYYSDALQNVKQSNYAVIITNPPIRAGKKVVHEIFEQSFNLLVEGGELWVVIQKKQGAPSAIDKLKELTAEVEIVGKEKGYFIIKATRTK
jgi:16S rRNA (guanine1207-N2)-methyltransferase